MKTVILSNGKEVKQEDLKVEDVVNCLPRFMSLAVGYENGWYVQTTDTHEETYLSCPIVEGLETFEKAKEVAQNISHITGMCIQIWHKEK